MPFPSITKACPKCLGNLFYKATDPHPERRGYHIHSYDCRDCGPMVALTMFGDDSWPCDWLNTRSHGESSTC